MDATNRNHFHYRRINRCIPLPIPTNLIGRWVSIVRRLAIFSWNVWLADFNCLLLFHFSFFVCFPSSFCSDVKWKWFRMVLYAHSCGVQISLHMNIRAHAHGHHTLHAHNAHTPIIINTRTEAARMPYARYKQQCRVIHYKCPYSFFKCVSFLHWKIAFLRDFLYFLFKKIWTAESTCREPLKTQNSSNAITLYNW